jgi:transmembrane 9 superfamily protein 2/4
MFVYYLLCAENHRWHWRAFNSAGAGAIFVFAFSIIYYVWTLRFTGFASMILFLGYSALMSFLFYILAGKLILIPLLSLSLSPYAYRRIGFIGFFSSFFFVRKIYSSIRVD